MFLTGSFSEYPLPQLLEILLHKRETGLLEVSSSQQCGHFYVNNGEIKNGEFGKVRGAAALDLAFSFEDGSFTFKRLDASEYARVVWEESFGHRNVVAESDPFAVRTILKQLPSFPIAAYGLPESAVLWVPGRPLQQLVVYLGVAYRTLQTLGVHIARPASLYTKAKCGALLRWAQYGRRAVAALRPVLLERQAIPHRYLQILFKRAGVLKIDFQTWHNALHTAKQVIFKAARILSLQTALALIQERRAQTNASFAMIVFVLIVGTTVSITKILRSNEEPTSVISTTVQSVAPQPETPPNIPRRRVKPKRRLIKQTPNNKQKVKNTETAALN